MPWLEFFTGKKAGRREEVSPEAAALAVSVGMAEDVPPPQQEAVQVSYEAPVWELMRNRLSEKVYLHLHCDRCQTDVNFDGPPEKDSLAMVNRTKCAHTPEVPEKVWALYKANYAGPLATMGAAYGRAVSKTGPDPRRTGTPNIPNGDTLVAPAGAFFSVEEQLND
jgi:hypothetical protein